MPKLALRRVRGRTYKKARAWAQAHLKAGKSKEKEAEKPGLLFHPQAHEKRPSSKKTKRKKAKPAPEPKPEPEPPLSTDLRTLMRTLPHPVVLLTTSLPVGPGVPNRHEQYRAMSLSSFTTVTLSPQPTISFNIRTPSHTFPAIPKNGNFMIHILAATPAGAKLAGMFTSGGGGVDVFKKIHEGKKEGKGIKVVEHEMVVKLKNGSRHQLIVTPRLEAEGVVRVLRCEVPYWNPRGGWKVGDHQLVFGVVREVLGEGEEGVNGLGYADGRYRGLGEVIEVEESGDVEERGEVV
jgi:hypothetical protein